MGKRKAGNTLQTPTKKFLNSEKRDVSSDSDPEDFEDHEPIDTEDSRIENGNATYEPDQLRVLTESFAEFLKTRQMGTTSVHNMERLVAEWAESRPEDAIDVGLFSADFRKYMKSAMKVANLQLSDASSILLTYISSEKSLKEYKYFPAKPPSRVLIYAKKMNLPTKPSDLASTYKHMRENKSANIIQQVEEEMRAGNVAYIQQLRGFLDSHPDLTAAQKHAITLRIKRLQKQAQPKTDAPKKKKPETAFGLFCRTKADKFRDLSEEDRERKLRKKFSKLSKPELDLLESLALNS
ncbi:unnamed protein product [Caenorhabditis sp. 36 PRJEB53466]|nr:unnamed protein product [Caenorhabditis sp. 36 PRJEB53466]